jgi:hypothetical protein
MMHIFRQNIQRFYFVIKKEALLPLMEFNPDFTYEIQSMIYAVTPCSSEGARHFGRAYGLQLES